MPECPEIVRVGFKADVPAFECRLPFEEGPQRVPVIGAAIDESLLRKNVEKIIREIYIIFDRRGQPVKIELKTPAHLSDVLPAGCVVCPESMAGSDLFRLRKEFAGQSEGIMGKEDVGILPKQRRKRDDPAASEGDELSAGVFITISRTPDGHHECGTFAVLPDRCLRTHHREIPDPGSPQGWIVVRESQGFDAGLAQPGEDLSAQFPGPEKNKRPLERGGFTVESGSLTVCCRCN